MINYLVLIPARGGSKGVPFKNIKLLGGTPLICYTLFEAAKVFKKSEIVISTDDPQIKEVCENNGFEVPFLRPKELAQDNSGSYEVILHALNYFESKHHKVDAVVLLQATSPFRNANQISEALRIFESEKMEMLVSVKEAKANPYFNLFEESKDGYLEKCKKGNITRRQDAPEVYEFNGAIYVIDAEAIKSKTIAELKKVKKYVMDEVSSHDIDTMFDWQIAEILINKSY